MFRQTSGIETVPTAILQHRNVHLRIVHRSEVAQRDVPWRSHREEVVGLSKLNSATTHGKSDQIVSKIKSCFTQLRRSKWKPVKLVMLSYTKRFPIFNGVPTLLRKSECKLQILQKKTTWYPRGANGSRYATEPHGQWVSGTPIAWHD